MKTFSLHKILHLARVASTVAVCVALGCMFYACKNSDLWNDVPPKVESFINQYFPMSQLQSVTKSGGVLHIRIDDGPGLTFDSNNDWESIDGYGMPLPQVLLFDQLPPALYDYLQETQNLDSVFSMMRDGVRYTLALLNFDLYYNAESGELTSSQADDDSAAKS